MPLAPAGGMPTLLDRQSLGKLGESLACDALRAQGYVILATRHRTRFGEIDIIAAHAGAVVFVEVKARRTARHGSAAESISPWKRRRIAAMALDYLAWTNHLESPCRFDVVAIDGIGTEKQTIRIIDNAWTVD
jgi:putative endonuclease